MSEEDTPILDVDSIVEPGDLILLNAYKMKHLVEPIKTNPNDIGRIYIFIPMISQHVFWFDPIYSFLENSKIV